MILALVEVVRNIKTAVEKINLEKKIKSTSFDVLFVFLYLLTNKEKRFYS